MAVKNQLNLTWIVVAAILGIAIFGYGFLNYLIKDKELRVKQDQIKTEEKIKQDQVNAEEKKTIIYKACAQEANKSAVSLIKDKLKLVDKDSSEYQVMKKAVDSDMYLQPDYETLNAQCLGRYGLK